MPQLNLMVISYDQGHAAAVSHYTNPLGIILIETKSGFWVFLDRDSGTIHDSGIYKLYHVCCGWSLKEYTPSLSTTSTSVKASIDWTFKHQLCIGGWCWVDQILNYASGAKGNVVYMSGTYWIDSWPTGQYTYLETAGVCT